MAVSKLGERVRCIWHISPALLTLGLYWYTQLVRMDVFWMLLPAALCFSAVEVLRFSSAWWRETFTLVFGLMLRDYEQTRASGTMFYLWGVTTAFLLPVRTEDSVAGVLLLCFCDPVAAAAGMTWGARPGAIQLRRGKSLAGFLAACFTGVCVTYFHQSHLRAGVIENDWNVVPLGARLLFCVLVGLATALIETSNIFDLDDNLLIPIGSAAAHWVFSQALLPHSAWGS